MGWTWLHSHGKPSEFLSLEQETRSDTSRTKLGLHTECLLFLYGFKQNVIILTDTIRCPNINCHKNLSSVSWGSIQADRHDDASKCFSHFSRISLIRELKLYLHNATCLYTQHLCTHTHHMYHILFNKIPFHLHHITVKSILTLYFLFYMTVNIWS
jgi:hypothetical protein